MFHAERLLAETYIRSIPKSSYLWTETSHEADAKRCAAFYAAIGEIYNRTDLLTSVRGVYYKDEDGVRHLGVIALWSEGGKVILIIPLSAACTARLHPFSMATGLPERATLYAHSDTRIPHYAYRNPVLLVVPDEDKLMFNWPRAENELLETTNMADTLRDLGEAAVTIREFRKR